MIDLTGIPTQSEFGALVGISQPAVSGLVSRGVLPADASLGTWLVAYCDHLREMAAGRAAGSGFDLGTERARLAREQADRIAMQNAVTRKTLAPAHLLEEVLSKAGARAARILDTIPGTLKRRAPNLSSDDLAVVSTIVAQARNIAAAVRIADLDVDVETDAPETADIVEIAPTTAGAQQ